MGGQSVHLREESGPARDRGVPFLTVQRPEQTLTFLMQA